MRKAIAIDFDGCLCESAWPEIGAPHTDVINAAIRERENGAALILWTCRVGGLLESAVEWCRSYGLEFDAVNANLPERISEYQTDCRKVSADEYWDDRAVCVPLSSNDQLTIEQLREMDEPVWAECGVTPFTPNGGYYCLCQCGNITAPSGAQFDIEEIPHWKFYRRQPEEGQHGKTT